MDHKIKSNQTSKYSNCYTTNENDYDILFHDCMVHYDIEERKISLDTFTPTLRR